MKFGAQLRNKSVPEWRSYNIDYNDLKQRIRITTELPNDDKRVEALYLAFIEEIDHVNMFLGSKLGEVKRRMQYVESAMDRADDSGTIDLESETNLKRLSADLQKLSRFIVIQKTGLRKLLKKYTKYSKDGGELNMRINKYMIETPDSFIHVDLVGLYLELALLYDLIREKQDRIQSQALKFASPQRRMSRVDPVVDLNVNEKFDFESIRKGNTKMTYLVHYDNLVELKLFLLSNFYFVDEAVQHERRSFQQQKQKSALSLREALKSRGSAEDFTRKPPAETTDDLRSQDIYRSNSIYINNTDELSNLGTTTTVFLDDPKHLHSIQTNGDPGMLVFDDHHKSRKILISAIGGIRKTSNVLLENDSFTDDLLEAINAGESYEAFVARHSNFFSSLDSLEKISIEWLFSRQIKPIVKVSSLKARFKPSRSDERTKLESWITLTSNIKLSSEDLATPAWTHTNESSFEDCPYAVLEVRFNSPVNRETELTDPLQKLLDSHLIFKVDESLSMLTYHLYLSNALGFTPEWAQLFDDDAVDIRKNPPKSRRAKSNKVSLSDISTKHNSISGESSQFKYWNEFDNGSDTEQGNGFFIDIDSDGDTLFPTSGVEYLFKITGKMKSFLHDKASFIFNNGNQPKLLDHSDPLYGSTDHSEAESLDDSASRSKATHDAFLVFLALSSAVISLVLVSVSLGITASLLGYSDVEVSPLVVGTLVCAMLVSLFFSVVSLCFLMMSDSENRNVWQTGFVWTVFITVTVLIMYGIVAAFGI
jgi:SPX domain protein involved in polyphosphate accumulation